MSDPVQKRSRSSSDEYTERKAKGTEGLIVIENPNRVHQKQKKSQLNLDDKRAPQLSKREREQIEQKETH